MIGAYPNTEGFGEGWTFHKQKGPKPAHAGLQTCVFGA